MLSIPACHAGDRGSIPRRGVFFTQSTCIHNGYTVQPGPVRPFLSKIHFYTLVTGVFRVPRGGTEVRT